MSKVGNIKSSYGEEITIAIANAPAEVILKNKQLPPNTLIIAAPVDKHKNDIGSYAMVMTDSDGSPIRLSYTIRPGNGLNINNDVLSLNIDKTTLTSTKSGISFNLSKIIDNNTIKLSNGKLYVDIDKVQLANDTSFGIMNIDDDSIKMNENGQIYADTVSLNRATDSQYGIVKGDDNTISIDNGIISVNTQNLVKASVDTFGVVKPDNNTIGVDANGSLYVNVDNLTKATNKHKGVLKVDGKTIKSRSGVLSVDYGAMPIASYTKQGLLKVGNESFINNNGNVNLVNTELFANETYTKLLNEIQQIQDAIIELSNSGISTNKQIYRISFANSSATDLDKPEYLEEPIFMINNKKQYVYITINIITQCDFLIGANFENNITPEASILGVIYDNTIRYDGVNCLDNVFPSTENKLKKVIILVDCTNFKSDRLPYQQITKLNITISPTDNTLLAKKLIYSIVRYNSNYDPNLQLIDGSESRDNFMDIEIVQLVLKTDDSYWRRTVSSLRNEEAKIIHKIAHLRRNYEDNKPGGEQVYIINGFDENIIAEIDKRIENK